MEKNDYFKTRETLIKNEEDLNDLRMITNQCLSPNSKKKTDYIPGVGDDGTTIGIVIDKTKLDLMIIS